MGPKIPVVGIVGLSRNIDSVLGKTPHITCRKPFVDYCYRFGLIPFIIAPNSEWQEHIIERIDGLLLPGGGDIHPDFYGEKNNHPELDWVDTQRDSFEIGLTRLALSRNIPVLGVCRGMQVINVATGGTLHQHLPDLPGTFCPHYVRIPYNKAVHNLQLTDNHSELYRVFGDAPTVKVNSIHHQGIDKLGEGLKVTAIADDGVIEGVESTKHGYVVGVQWHPELLDDSLQERLFQSFAQAVRNRLQ